MKSVLTQSIPLGRIRGIPISVHWTFGILLLIILLINLIKGQSLQAVAWLLFFILSLFACVLLHELGHAFAARAYGIHTKSITLLPIGGVAHLEKLPEEPGKEIVVALAGPLVNMLISTFLWLYLGFAGIEVSEDFIQTGIGSHNFLFMLMTVNIFIGLFNLLPAIPMDGGRVLRAALSMKMGRLRATQAATKITTLFAVLFVIVGIFHNPMLILIALFIYMGARGEFEMVKSKMLLSDARVSQVLMRNYTLLDAADTIEKATAALLNGQDTRFLVQEEDNITSVLTKTDIIRALSENAKKSHIRQYASPIRYRVNTSEPLEKVLHHMSTHGFSIVPVEENGKIIGILDIDNIQEFLLVRTYEHAHKEHTER